MLEQIPILVFGDRDSAIVDEAKAIGLGEEWVYGDPMSVELDAIVSPANTVGEMSGGYDLAIRNKLGGQVQQIAMASLENEKLFLGQARVVESRNSAIPLMIIVPTVVGALAGGNTEVGSLQTKTPCLDVIEAGTYNFMWVAHRSGVARLGSVLLGGGVGGVAKGAALRAMLKGYERAYDEIDELLFGAV